MGNFKKGKQIIAVVNSDGKIEAAAYCLSTDSWQDYEFYLEQARLHSNSGEMRLANRELRAGLLFLFAHLEGVVSQIENEKNIPEEYGIGRLCDKTRNINREAKKKGHVPYLNFRLGKHIRDILVHPGIEKTFEDDEKLDETSVYKELSVQSLADLGNSINAWLDAVCGILGVQRFTDTKAILEDFFKGTGSTIEIKEI